MPSNGGRGHRPAEREICQPYLRLLHRCPVATENRIRTGADTAIGYPGFGMHYDARMFYLAYQARNDRLKSFKVTFPTVVQQPMENVIAEMYRSFTGERPKSKAITAECKPYKA